ncbi:MAG: site-specific integrase [Mogibacterium sp.]|nr:site-specific integrase [Mogibacterium sp.]
MSGTKANIKAENGEGSFRYNSAGNLEYRFSYKDENGKAKRKSVSGRDVSECYRKAEEFMNILVLKKNHIDPDMTIITILENRYKKDLALGYTGEQGYCRNLSNLRILEKAAFASKPIREVKEEDVFEYIESLRKYSSSMVKQLFRQVKLGFTLAKEDKIIMVSLMDNRDMKCPKIGKPVKKVSSLTREEQKKLVDFMTIKAPPEGRNDYRLQLFIELYSGMRMGEINALRTEDVDLENNVIHVRSTISRGLEYREFVKDGTKTESGQRDVPISKTLRPYIEEALERQQPNEENLIFYDYNKDSVISTSQVNCYYQRTCRTIGIPADGQHSLRHTFATRCIESGVPPVVLKTWLGHTDIHITLDTYTDVFKSLDHSAVSTLDDYLDSM